MSHLVNLGFCWIGPIRCIVELSLRLLQCCFSGHVRPLLGNGARGQWQFWSGRHETTQRCLSVVRLEDWQALAVLERARSRSLTISVFGVSLAVRKAIPWIVSVSVGIVVLDILAAEETWFASSFPLSSLRGSCGSRSISPRMVVSRLVCVKVQDSLLVVCQGLGAYEGRQFSSATRVPCEQVLNRSLAQPTPTAWISLHRVGRLPPALILYE